MKRQLLFLLLTGVCLQAFAQQKFTEGLVFDAITKDRIAIVNITNLRTGESMYNGLNGAFKVASEPGDMLVFSKIDYFNDTVRVSNDTAAVIYLSRTGITLKEVNVFDKLLSPTRTPNDPVRFIQNLYGGSIEGSLWMGHEDFKKMVSGILALK